MAVITAQNLAEVAHPKHQILGQESSEGKASKDEISKVSKSSPSLKHYIVPSPKVITEVESKDRHLKEMFTQIHLWIDKLSHMDTPHFVQCLSPFQ